MNTTGPPKGHLLIHGGTSSGRLDQETVDQFVKLCGGPGSNIVYIPTAEEDAKITRKNGDVGLCHGLNFTTLHTYARLEADHDCFVRPITNATGVFIQGGRQPRLATAYLNTRTQKELECLLDRGGVILGTSAGATILGSYLVRNQGPPGYDPNVMVDPNHAADGFGFIKNIAIDQHIAQRGRENDLVDVVKTHPELLGVGIDEHTAVHVIGDRFSVIGNGSVYIHDGTNPWYRLGNGTIFDLASRKPV